MTRSYPLGGESSVFVLLANGNDNEPIPGKGKTLVCIAILLILMIAGATIGELPVVKEMFRGHEVGYVLLCFCHYHYHGLD